MAQEIILVDPLDGSSNGKARIKSGKLQSRTISVPDLQDSTEQGRGYNVIGTHTVALSATIENVLYLKNISKTERLHIVKIKFLSSLGGSEYNVYMNPVYTSGGTTITPVNMRSDVTVDDSETQIFDNSLSDLVLVNTFNVAPVISEGRVHSHDFKDSLILTPGGSISIDVIHPTLLPAVKVSMLFRIESLTGIN